MRPRMLLAVPALVLLACTGAGNGGPASASPPHHSNSAAAVAYANWPTYHGNGLRTGNAPSMPTATGTPKVVARYNLDGQVFASPIIIGGTFIAVTENDTVYAIRLGKVLWKRHLGTPAQQSQLPCGNVFPLGITGTPAYNKGLIYVAAEYSGNPPRHELAAIRMSNGTVAFRRSLDLAGVEQKAMQERGALVVAGTRVWVPFGGLAGDCGGYKGRVVGIPLNGSGGAVAYTVPTQREAGIWTPPGPSWDGQSLYVSVGNGAATSGPWDHSDSILKISANAKLQQAFAPSNWPSENASDADLGSQGPAIVGKWVFIDGKGGTAYVLNRANLGGVGRQVSSTSLCRSFGGTAVIGPAVYVPCTDGLRKITIDASGHVHKVWQAASNIIGPAVIGGG
ncbi:MAG TPA: hypothetical protein VKB75_13695, partial [Jatrophihabitans sp.]|nr:hypothetical protein [Jatrophihabitans sp.]